MILQTCMGHSQSLRVESLACWYNTISLLGFIVGREKKDYHQDEHDSVNLSQGDYRLSKHVGLCERTI
jgi:hypothetical protein